jgi:hypothetical protein
MIHHKPFLGRQTAQFLFLKIITQNPPLPQQFFTNTLVFATPTLQTRRVALVSDLLGGLAIAVAVTTMPPGNSILPSVLPDKGLDNFFILIRFLPFLPIIVIWVYGLGGLFWGGRSGGLGLGVLEGRSSRGSGSLLLFLASFSLIDKEKHLANPARRCTGLLLALFSCVRPGHGL